MQIPGPNLKKAFGAAGTSNGFPIFEMCISTNVTPNCPSFANQDGEFKSSVTRRSQEFPKLSMGKVLTGDLVCKEHRNLSQGVALHNVELAISRVDAHGTSIPRDYQI